MTCVAITDHSPSTGVVAGLDGARLRAQATEIARVQEDCPDIRILRGCEVDILPDGTLDLDDEILSGLDLDHRGLCTCGELGVRVVVSSDAHSVTRLDNISYGVDQARRGWLQSSQIVNTGTLDEVSSRIGRRRL